jgi:hypothetical protein
MSALTQSSYPCLHILFQRESRQPGPWDKARNTLFSSQRRVCTNKKQTFRDKAKRSFWSVWHCLGMKAWTGLNCSDQRVATGHQRQIGL